MSREKDATKIKTHKNAVVLTVPHARCPPFLMEHEGHPCDVRALDFARRLKNNFISGSNFKGEWDLYFFFSDVVRSRCDMNRIRCRQTLWRKGIEKVMMERSELTKRGTPKTGSEKNWLLDIHSYPSHAKDFGRYEFLILIDDVETNPVTGRELYPSYAVDLYDRMNERGIVAGLFRGDKNDIVDQGAEFGFYAMLLEINESLDPKRVEFVAKTIANWLFVYE